MNTVAMVRALRLCSIFQGYFFHFLGPVWGYGAVHKKIMRANTNGVRRLREEGGENAFLIGFILVA